MKGKLIVITFMLLTSILIPIAFNSLTLLLPTPKSFPNTFILTSNNGTQTDGFGDDFDDPWYPG